MGAGAQKIVQRRAREIVAGTQIKMHSAEVRNALLARRAVTMERYMRLAFREMASKGLLTSAHNYGHVSRVANYGEMYVQTMGGSKTEQVLTRIVGFGHDRFRDPVDSMDKSRKIEHPEQAANFFKPMFEKRFTQETSDKMVQAILKHDNFPQLSEVGKNLIADGLVYADKFFEANGAYIGFRRSMFMAERAKAEDVVGKEKDAIKKIIEENRFDLRKPEDLQKAAVAATVYESNIRIKKFSDMSTIPEHLRPFVQYQVQWQHRLVEALKMGDKGMVSLVTAMFAEGLKEKPRDLGEMIKGYQPVGETDRAFKKEAMRYLNGELAEKFRQLVKRPAA